MSGDYTQLLINLALTFPTAEQRREYIFLDPGGQKLGNEFISPFFARGDDQWADIVTWVVYAPMQAAELGITKDMAVRDQGNMVKNRLLFQNPVFQALSLPSNTVSEIVRVVGNYEEMYERNLYSILLAIRTDTDLEVSSIQAEISRLRILISGYNLQTNLTQQQQQQKADLEKELTVQEALLKSAITGPNKLASKFGQIAPPPVGDASDLLTPTPSPTP